MDPQKREMSEKRLIRWLAIATLALLILVLGLRAWQMLRSGPAPQEALVQDAASGPEDPQAAGAAVPSGKAAVIEDVRALNGSLSADDLEKLSDEELEQLRRANAPGLPIGISAAVQAAEEYAGTLEVDSVTSETDPELDEARPHYEVELHHPTLGDFEYKIDAYSGEVLEGTPDIMQSLQDAGTGAASRDSGPQESAGGAKDPTPKAPAKTASGEEAAKKAAFAHAGVSAADASVTKCKLDWEDGRQVYEIEFWVGNTEYDYEIDASSGAVLKSEHKQEERRTGAPQSGSLIGEEAAKKAAFAHAGVSSADASVTKCKLDWEDGRQVYEIEFWVGNTEYDYEIDASSGAVLKSEYKQEERRTGAPQSGSLIGEEAAKKAAFAHAGVSSADASVTNCKLDWEDGRQVYEIEFWVEGIEYDYEVDASSGTVLKSGQEWGGASSGSGAQGSGFIGEEAAKKAAFAHAGVSAADAGYVRCELDEDGGLWLYEIEFQVGAAEYEYGIDASSGAVLKAGRDH